MPSLSNLTLTVMQWNRRLHSVIFVGCTEAGSVQDGMSFGVVNDERHTVTNSFREAKEVTENLAGPGWEVTIIVAVVLDKDHLPEREGK